jgi:hypothetical protein
MNWIIIPCNKMKEEKASARVFSQPTLDFLKRVRTFLTSSSLPFEDIVPDRSDPKRIISLSEFQVIHEILGELIHIFDELAEPVLLIST